MKTKLKIISSRTIILSFLVLIINYSSFSQIRRIGFNPARHSFHFANRFVSTGPINTAGLCGGMCLAAFNYYRYNVEIPHYTDSDINFTVMYDLGLSTAPGTNPVVDYIFHSQIATFEHSAIPWFFGSPLANTDYNVEFENVKRVIDSNRAVILGLKGWNGHASHQVLCYGYNTNGKKLFVYDPNRPDIETTITAGQTGPDYHLILNSPGYPTCVDYKFAFLTIELDQNIRSNRTSYNIFTNPGDNFSVRPIFVPIPPSTMTAYAHIAKTSNISGNSTIIDNTNTNGNPNAKIFVTPEYNSSNKNIGVWYNSSTQKWAIFNQDQTAINPNSKYYIVIENTTANVHQSNTTNTTYNYTHINHPLANNNPNAKVFVTQRWNYAAANNGYNNRAIGVWYNSSVGKWAIYNEDQASMGIGLEFNVLVSNPDSNTETITLSNQGLSSYTNSNMISLFTHNYNPNYTYCNTKWGIFYSVDYYTWGVASNDLSTANLTFNVKKFSSSGSYTSRMVVQDSDTKSIITNPKTKKETIKIHPNPTVDAIDIFTTEEIKKIQILNAKSNLKVYEGNKTHIDLSNQKKGVYIIIVNTKDNSYTNKIIKN